LHPWSKAWRISSSHQAGEVNSAGGLEASSILCKFLEGFSLPGAVQVTDHTEHDPVTAVRIGEAGHGSGAASDLPKGAFDHVGGTHLLPVRGGNGEEAEELLQVAFHTSYRPGPPLPPTARPAPKRPLGFSTIPSAIDRCRLGHTRAFFLGHLVGNVA